jgi:hypothetical protein
MHATRCLWIEHITNKSRKGLQRRCRFYAVNLHTKSPMHSLCMPKQVVMKVLWTIKGET